MATCLSAVAHISPFISAKQMYIAIMERKTEILILDVRQPDEYEAIHISGSVLHCLPELNVDIIKTLMSSEKKVDCFVICKSGGRAGKAASKLIENGDFFINLKVYD